MKQTDSSKQPVQLSLEDIPEALREDSSAPQSSSWSFWLLGIGLGLGATIFLVVTFLLPTGIFSLVQSKTPIKTEPEIIMGPIVPNPFPQPDNLLGHYPYEEANLSDLKPITSNGEILMHTEAAEKFLAMQRAAKAQGIILQALSGFRSVEEQNRIFFEVKETRGQPATKRAEVSAPPGYSEHHTGYAVDIGDGKFPSTHLSPTFENTAAYRWLEKNAPYYSFELSFPKDNNQGVNYEPWHWRYVGNRNSLEIFYKARNIKTPINNNFDRP